MEVLIDIAKQVFEKMPYQVFVAVFAVIIITELTKNILAKLEKKLEAKKGKEIKFFDHTKIILSLFWSLLLAVSFAFGKIYTWAELPLYFLVIVGGATILYELVWKQIKKITSN